mgnify:CR=1 FL=1
MHKCTLLYRKVIHLIDMTKCYRGKFTNNTINGDLLIPTAGNRDKNNRGPLQMK